MIPSVSSFFSMAELGETSRHQQQPQRESPFQQHFQVHHQPQSLGGSFYPHQQHQQQQQQHQQQQQQQQQQHHQYTKDWSSAASPSSPPFASNTSSTFAPLSFSGPENVNPFSPAPAPSPSNSNDCHANLNINWVSPKSQPHVYQQTETSHHTTTTQKTETVTYEKLPDGTVRTTRTRQKNVTSTVTHQRTCTSY